MKRVYSILTSTIILIIIIHITYMVLGLAGVGKFNQSFALTLGYALMYMAIVHGVYGLIKWLYVVIMKNKLKKKNGKTSKVTVLSATIVTLIQRISGVLIVALVVPHTIIRLESAGVLLTIVDVLFVLSLVIHIFVGIPKWLVLMGFVNEKLEKKLLGFYGGNKK